ncbi:MAG: exosortase/archaeosortase family protein [Gammaproteobacteria bacterium]
MQWSAEHNAYVDEGTLELPPRSPSGRPSGLVIRALCFLAIFAALQLTWEALRGSVVERLVVHDGTVRPAAFLANLLTPDVHAHAVDFSLRAPGGGLRILNGCEGVEALFLLAAALGVASVPWKTRWLGLLAGLPLVFLINQARILVLFYSYRANPGLFGTLHAVVAPIVVVLAIAMYFYGWLTYASRHDAKPG